ncbi:hypothetical protein MMC29_001430 [Sticta canariensis]|nr:hypothetical protein [Sticta canariensis]
MYRLEGESGKVVKVLYEPLLKPDGGSFGVGINEMSVFGRHPYFNNTDQNILACIAIHNNGASNGSAPEVIISVNSPTGFVYNWDEMYVAQHRVNRLESVSGNIVTTLAPNFREMESGLFGPAALAW